MHPIIKEIFDSHSLSDEESQLVFSKLQKQTFTKGELLIKEKAIVNHLFYVHTGCLRSFLIAPDMKEHTLQFAIKGWWISDYIALYGRTKTTAVSYIECIKDAIVYSIAKSDFDNLCLAVPKVAQVHIRKMELAFASLQNRILENLTLSAKQRYINFVTAYPHIVNDVKNYHIASYLGITTESLSRVRKEIATS